MDNRLKALIDLLGLSSVLNSSDPVRDDAVFQLLTSFVEAKSNSGVDIKCIGSDRRDCAVWPAISAFSDHILFSYSSDEVEHIGAGPIVIRLAEDVAWIFSRAIKFGCLMRGGIAFAPLHHKDGVVFGRALVEAHELESKFVGRPRIIVSAGAAEKLGPNPYFYLDDDGFSCLTMCGPPTIWKCSKNATGENPR